MNKKVKYSVLNLSLVGAIGFSSATALAAQPAGDDSIQLADVYVRPDYLEIQSLKDTKEIITITKQDIEGKGYANLSDVLREVPSISVDTAGRGVIDIRGQGSEGAQRNIQILVDGAPVNTLTEHPYVPDYNLVPVNNIEKIEIIPGGGSVLYGAGAVGGVVNITTNLKNMDKAKSKFTTQVSNLGHNLGTDLKFKLDDKTVANVGYNRGKEYFYFNNTYIDKDYLYGGISHELNKGKIAFRYSKVKDKGQYIYNSSKEAIDTFGKDYVPLRKKMVGIDKKGKGIYKYLPAYNKADREMASYNLSFQKDLGKRWGITTDVFYNNGYFTNNKEDDRKLDQTGRGIRLKFDHGYGKNDNLLLGIDYVKQDLDLEYNNQRIIKKQIVNIPLRFYYDRKKLGFYALNKMNRGKWTMTQGLRREKIDWSFDKNAANGYAGKGTKKDWETAAELSAAYNYNDTGRIYVRWEKGYSLPNGAQISDSYGYDGKKYIITGAENEHYNNYEIGIRDKIGISTVKITGYLSTVDNQIQRVYVDGLKDARTVNLVNTKRKGIDVDLSQRFGKLKVSESLTFLKGESHYTQAGLNYFKELKEQNKNIDTQKKDFTTSGLQYVPTRKASIKLDYDFTDKTSMGLRWTYFGKYNNFIDEEEHKEANIMRSHSLTDLYWRHKENEYVEFYGGISNLFNKRYYRYASQGTDTIYIGQSRNYYVGLNYNF